MNAFFSDMSTEVFATRKGGGHWVAAAVIGLEREF